MRQALTREEEGVVIADRYALCARLGRGATSRVYEAWDNLTKRSVALKRIRPYATEDKLRIEREVAALRILRLPSVAALLDAGTDQDEVFLVLELIPGRPFPGVDGVVSWSTLAPLAERLLETLGRVHAAGVVHRDIKPANVLVTEDGSLGLLDFGLAWGPALGSGVTKDFVGTVRYASPEQFLRGKVDARADLYSVGVMLFEALAGRPPWSDAEVLKLARSRRSMEPPPLRSVCPEVPPYACALVDSLLRRIPDERPRSAADALHGLRASATVELRTHRLPWLGSATAIDMIDGVLAAGHSIDISGPAGSGRSRLLLEVANRLEARGQPVAWVMPGTTTFESLARLAPLPTRGADGYTMMEANLRAALDEGTALLVDDLVRVDHSTRRLLERIRGRMPIVRVVPRSGDIRLGPLPEAALRGLFAGPDRVLHLREDGARELHARTGGLAGNVAVEAMAWVTGGIAAWQGDHLRVSRDGLDRLSVGLRTAALVRTTMEGVDKLEPQLRNLLGWTIFAGEHASVELLAKVCGEQEWAVAMEVEHLVELGHLAVDADGHIRVHADPGTVDQWSEEQTQIAHAAIAAALPIGAGGRLGHLLAAVDLEGAQAECEHCANELAEEGAPGRAFALSQIALSLARQRGADASGILVHMAGLATELQSQRAIGQVLYELRRARKTPLLTAATGVLHATDASFVGDHGRARATAEAIGPLQDPTLEGARLAVIVRAVMTLAPDRCAALLASLEAATTASPLLRARWLGWNGHWAREQGRFIEGAEAHVRAAAVGGARRQRQMHLLNAAVCQLDALALDAARELAQACLDMARRAHNPSLELRTEILLRDIAYRNGTAGSADLELVQAMELLGSPGDYVVYFQEALIAAANGEPTVALQLANRCRDLGRERGHARAATAGEVLVRALGGERDLNDRELHDAIRKTHERRLQLQFLTLYALTLPVPAAAALAPRIEELALEVPEALRGVSLEIHSAERCRQLLAAHLAGQPVAPIRLGR